MTVTDYKITIIDDINNPDIIRISAITDDKTINRVASSSLFQTEADMATWLIQQPNGNRNLNSKTGIYTVTHHTEHIIDGELEYDQEVIDTVIKSTLYDCIVDLAACETAINNAATVDDLKPILVDLARAINLLSKNICC
jgi:hypothetical protein